MRAAVRARGELDPLLLGRKRRAAPAGLSAGETHRTLALLVVIPWLTFSAIVLLCTHMLRHAPQLLLVLLAAAAALCVRQSAVNYMRGSADGAYAMALCVASMVIGILVGYHNYNSNMRPYWEYEDHRHYKGIGPEEPADALRDASAIFFADGVRPDPQASVGFHSGPTIYCVAPVGTWAAGASISEIQFWAAGQDCCKARGSFGCDEASSPSARGGLVVRNDEEVKKYTHAVRVAEAENGVRAPAEPIFLRWVVNVDTARDAILNQAWIFWALASFAYLPLSAALVVLAPSSLRSIEVLSKRKQEEYDG